MIKSLIGFVVGHAEFSQDIIVAIVGVVIGSFFTVRINNKATRKQAEFNMQYELLKDYHKTVQEFCHELTSIEISLSLEKNKIEVLADRIQRLDTSMVRFSNRLQEERKFVRKYISANLVQRFIKETLRFNSVFFTQNIDKNAVFPNFNLIEKVDKEDFALLYSVETEMEKIDICFSDSMECILCPGIFGRIKRKIRQPLMMIEEGIAFFRIGKRK